MTPTLPTPTDNLYKFACLFGLALILSSVLAMVATYTSTQEKVVKHIEAIIALDARASRSKTEEDLLALNRRLLDVTTQNQRIGSVAIGFLAGLGLCISAYGAMRWKTVVQPRDDRLADLNLAKAEAEIARTKMETARLAAELRPIVPAAKGQVAPQ